MMTFKEYRAARVRYLRENYPDITPEETRALLATCEGEWIASLQFLPRTAVVPMSVGLSLVAVVGHAEASRMLRHVANFPACLPVTHAL